MWVQVRGRSGQVFARERVDDPDAAINVATRWVRLMVEDAADPLDGICDIPAVEVVPDVAVTDGPLPDHPMWV